MWSGHKIFFFHFLSRRPLIAASLVGFGVVLYLVTRHNPTQLISFGGLVILILICYAISTNPSKVEFAFLFFNCFRIPVHTNRAIRIEDILISNQISQLDTGHHFSFVCVDGVQQKYHVLNVCQNNLLTFLTSNKITNRIIKCNILAGI